ncbi:MAG: histidine phosphatase family protein [Pseudomonadota bacterium]
MTKLALLRHGHTAWNRAGRIQGRSDIPLDEDAVTVLQALALPSPWDTAELWSSPLERAVHTAQLVSGRNPNTDPALTEMNWGAWEGLHGAGLAEQADSGFRHIEDWGWDYRPPQGESPAEVWARLKPWVLDRKQDAVAVCHIGIMRVLMARATRWDFHGTPPFRIKRNRLFVINLTAGTLTSEGEPVRLIPKGKG